MYITLINPAAEWGAHCPVVGKVLTYTFTGGK